MDETMFPDPPTLKPFLDEKREEGKKQRTIEIAKAMLKEELPLETVMKVTGLNEKELDEIKCMQLKKHAHDDQ
ncbi:hypothetical protein [Shouchella shacheensis]|uniref:hypothetical protein n=1 Tax=Shouchella shacheensis TaxID=1649580 RepID=UPI00074053EC|nr:hypothetical protein [Shouchella shacheensis]